MISFHDGIGILIDLILKIRLHPYNDLSITFFFTGSQRWLYNSDISRTWPVSGQFSKYHRILYELVLTVQVFFFK